MFFSPVPFFFSYKIQFENYNLKKKKKKKKKSKSSSQMKCLNNMRLIVPSENAKYMEWKFVLYTPVIFGFFFDVILVAVVVVTRIKMTNLITLWAVLSKWHTIANKKTTEIVIFDECS